MNVSANQPSVTNMSSSNNNEKRDVKSYDDEKDDKKRSRSPSREEEDDGADDQDEQTMKDVCSTYLMDAIIDSDNEANGCCFDYSRRLHEEPPYRSRPGDNRPTMHNELRLPGEHRETCLFQCSNKNYSRSTILGKPPSAPLLSCIHPSTCGRITSP